MQSEMRGIHQQFCNTKRSGCSWFRVGCKLLKDFGLTEDVQNEMPLVLAIEVFY